MARQATKRTVAKARRLRREMSLPEVLLCAAAKLGIEVDGIAHDMGDRPNRDQARNIFPTARRFEIVRIPASEVLTSPEGLAASIEALCRARTA